MKLTKRTLYVDFGNGYVKALNHKQDLITFPSMVSPIIDVDKFPGESILEVVKTTETSQIKAGDKYLVGNAALDFAPNKCCRVDDYDLSTGKAKQGLQLLTELLEPVDCDYRIVCSVPDVTVQGKDLEAALLGSHSFIKGGVKFTIRIVEVVVKPESWGAVYFAVRKGLVIKNKKTVAIDLGQQTTICSTFTKSGQEVNDERFVIPDGGCSSFYLQIAENTEVKQHFKRPIPVYQVERALREFYENPTATQCMLGDMDITKLVAKVKYQWWESIGRVAGKLIQNIKLELGSVVFLGGGASYLEKEISSIRSSVTLDAYAAVKGLALADSQNKSK